MIVGDNTEEMPKSEWLLRRRGGLGGSEAATIMGHNRFGNIEDLFFSKVCKDCPPEEAGNNNAAYWGTVLEDVVAKEFAKRNDFLVVPVHRMLWSAEYPWMLANVDRACFEFSPSSKSMEERAIKSAAPETEAGWVPLEIKTSSAFLLREWEKEEPPQWVTDQVYHYMIVTGADHAWIAVLIGGREYIQFFLERDESYAQQMIEAEGAFWRRVQEACPDPGWRRQAVPEPAATGGVELKAGTKALVLEYADMQRTAKTVDVHLKSLRDQILKELAGAAVGTVSGVPWVRVSASKQSRVDVKRLRESYPDLAAELTTESSSERFTVLGREE